MRFQTLDMRFQTLCMRFQTLVCVSRHFMDITSSPRLSWHPQGLFFRRKSAFLGNIFASRHFIYVSRHLSCVSRHLHAFPDTLWTLQARRDQAGCRRRFFFTRNDVPRFLRHEIPQKTSCLRQVKGRSRYETHANACKT